MIKGKVAYMAPEQARGERVDRRADIFSVGVMLWEALIGKRFAGGSKVSEVTKMHDRVTGREARLRDVCEDVAPELEQICESALALAPEARTPTALQFAEEIERYLVTQIFCPAAEELALAMEPAFREERAQIAGLLQQQMMLRSEQSGSLPAPNTASLIPRMKACAGPGWPPSSPLRCWVRPI